MATKLGRIVTYLDKLLLIKSHDLLVTWSFEISHIHIITCSCDIAWKTKIVIYLVTQYLWLSILAGWGYTMSSFLP